MIFMALLVVVMISTASATAFAQNTLNSNAPHLHFLSATSIDVLFLFITFIILFNTFVPISLYVTLETVKVFQAKLIANDPQMCARKPCTYTVVPEGGRGWAVGDLIAVLGWAADVTGTTRSGACGLRRAPQTCMRISARSTTSSLTRQVGGGAVAAVLGVRVLRWCSVQCTGVLVEPGSRAEGAVCPVYTRVPCISCWHC